jgi:hypothetical protein
MVSNSAVTFQRPPALVFFVLLYAANSNIVAGQAGDFGFRFEVKDCLAGQLDTFDGVYEEPWGSACANCHGANFTYRCSNAGNLPNR